MSTGQAHWDEIFASRPEEALAWFENEAAVSLDLIGGCVAPGDSIIDIGGGASRLVDGLLGRGLGPVSVLDLSPAALEISRRRLGARAEQVTWIGGDITRWTAGNAYALWHDRAVFHFLTEPADRTAYVATMCAALTDGGTAIIATFDENGPERCANLPVVRYGPAALADELGRLQPGCFEPVCARRHLHRTPTGRDQSFQTSVFRKRG